MTQAIPRPEHPRPQLRRDAWINLNGPWTYTLDPGKSGMERGFQAVSYTHLTLPTSDLV